MSTPWALDINRRKKLIGTLAIHVNYRSYRLQVPKYECGKCSREDKEGMFGLCNKVLEIDVTYLTTIEIRTSASKPGIIPCSLQYVKQAQVGLIKPNGSTFDVLHRP